MWLQRARLPRPTPLSVGIAALLALSPSALIAGNVWPVTVCDDSGPGTLRNTIATPTTLSGDVVELGGLACSTITLTTGGTSIPVTQTNLTIRNTGPHAMMIDGSALQDGITAGNSSRIFTHTGTGTLSIEHVDLTGGHVNHDGENAYGGCVDSLGNIALLDSTVSACSAYSKALFAKGGGIRAAGTVKLIDSNIIGNTAISAAAAVMGAGIFSQGNLQADHSAVGGNYSRGGSFNGGGGIASASSIALAFCTISNNTAKTLAYGAYGGGLYGHDLTLDYTTLSGNSVLGTAGYGVGGGALSQTNVTLRHSTISANTSSAAIGGIAAVALGPGNSNAFYMAQSTVSGNSTNGLIGGIGVNSANVKLYNSTVAFNTAAGTSASNQIYAPGIALNAQQNAMSVTLSSNLISNNTYAAGSERDLSTANTDLHAITFNAAPANNLIRVSFVAGSSPLPADTLSGSCPLLGPLRNNGGPTRTHALLSGSVAIDTGNNVKAFSEDQRGLASDIAPLPYPRVSNLVADIGAYEVNQADVVFNSGMDGCPALN